jgi:two-component system sensor histidine kinase YesM
VVEEDGDDLKIAVRDNGKGISSSQLAMLQRSMSREKEPEEMSPQLISQGRQGIGVVNTDARIRLVYGDHYGLFIESREQEYTLVTIKIRLERDNDV